MKRTPGSRSASADGERVARQFGQLPIPNVTLPPVREAALYGVSVWLFLVFLPPYALHNVPVPRRFVESAGYSTSVFIGVLAVRLLLQGTVLGRRPPADGAKQIVQNALRVLLIGGLNSLLGSYFDMEPLTPHLLLHYFGMTSAVAGFALLLTLLVLWLFWYRRPKGAAGNNEPTAVLQSPETSDSLRLSSTSLVYLESAGNYVKAVYLEAETVVEREIRISLAMAEQQLRALGLVRCHRSYFVNMRFVCDLKGPARKSYVLFYRDTLGDHYVPVSRTYVKHLRQLLNRRGRESAGAISSR